jgi:DNA-directed RNA polymerase subunit RPC12/RpoP
MVYPSPTFGGTMAETVVTDVQCMKCKKKVENVTLTVELNAKGRRTGKGLCPTCGTKVFKFLPKA